MKTWKVNAVALPLNEACWIGGYGSLNAQFSGGPYRNAIAAQQAVIKTYPDVSQFWTYDKTAFLKNPVYSRDYPLAKNLEQ